MCKLSTSDIPSLPKLGQTRKCILKSRKEVLKDRRVRIPASTFLEASRYGLDVARKGLQHEKAGTLYWHDPWGIREALLYSLRNACVALDCCGSSRVRDLKIAIKRLVSTSSSGVGTAMCALQEITGKEWNRDLKNRQIAFSTNEELNSVCVDLKGHGIKTSFVELSDGGRLPRLGFGTAIFHKDCECERNHRCQACSNMKETLHAAVTDAVKQGYRHFDCAQCYNNEETIGGALKASGVRREKLFLASKLSYFEDYGATATTKLVRRQMQKLQTSYLDLYYLHDDIADASREKAAWRALERLHEQGVIKHLGLSNYRVEGIKRILKFARVQPSVLQVKYDVYHPGYQWGEEKIDNVVSFAQSRGISVVGYANFSGWPSLLQARSDPHICNMAQRHERTPTQILLRHGLQKGLALIPASTNHAHIQSNKELFDFSLSKTDVAYLDGLASFAEFEHVPWLPQWNACD